MAAIPILRLRAPAKINLHLSVGALRADGYHDVETVVHALGLFDVVTVRPADRLSLVCDPDPGTAQEDNTAWRAALSIAERAGRDPRVAITIDKRIPHAAGLGGGSADAAAVVWGLCTWWGLDPQGPEAMEAAAHVGADVPFFLVGGAALLTGRGDEFSRRLPSLSMDVALVNPGSCVSTGEAYTVFDRTGSEGRPSDRMIEAVVAGDQDAVAGALFNNLTAASVSLAPEIGDVLAWCGSREGVLASAVAGSGATVFALCTHTEAAAGIAGAARERGWWALATRTSASGVVLDGPGDEGRTP